MPTDPGLGAWRAKAAAPSQVSGQLDGGRGSGGQVPDQALGRQGLYGDFFSFYFCDIILKLNGKGGQPVYVKIAGQSTGRCTPR